MILSSAGVQQRLRLRPRPLKTIWAGDGTIKTGVCGMASTSTSTSTAEPTTVVADYVPVTSEFVPGAGAPLRIRDGIVIFLVLVVVAVALGVYYVKQNKRKRGGGGGTDLEYGELEDDEVILYNMALCEEKRKSDFNDCDYASAHGKTKCSSNVRGLYDGPYAKLLCDSRV